MNQPRTDIHFYHVPKTAGSSLSLMIRATYPAAECCPAQTVRELVALRPDRVPGYRCYTGHLFTLLEPLAGRTIPTVTVLRDPFEQTMSLIRHCQRFDLVAGIRGPLIARGLEKAWKWWPALRQRIEAGWCPVVMNNFQTRVLGSEIEHPGRLSRNYYGFTYPFLNPGFSSPDVDMDAIFERAKARLRSMAVVGTVERYAETVGAIFGMLGAKPPQVMQWHNSGRGTADRHRGYRESGLVLDQFARLIDEQNHYDSALHRFAGELLDARLRRADVGSDTA